jgi:hypothetical protein
VRIFIVGAVVLIVFAIIATAHGVCLGVTWESWACAALLSFFVDCLLGTTVGNGGVVWRRPNQPVV